MWVLCFHFYILALNQKTWVCYEDKKYFSWYQTKEECEIKEFEFLNNYLKNGFITIDQADWSNYECREMVTS